MSRSVRAGDSALESKPLRTVFCTRGGFFGALVLERLLACEDIEICAIVRSSRNFRPGYGFLRGVWRYLRASGVAYALYLVCATSVADLVRARCAIGRAGRGRRATPATLSTRDLNDPRGLEFLRACAPELLVSAFFDQRLHAPALAIPALACLNIHPSLLPGFRGVDPVLQARLHRSPELGVTVHYMTPALDEGRILAQQVVPVPGAASLLKSTAILYAAGAELLTGSLARVRDGDPGAPQGASGSYQSWPTRAELRAFRTLGGVLMRWSDFWRLAGGRRKRAARAGCP